jgi:hypothetical protein
MFGPPIKHCTMHGMVGRMLWLAKEPGAESDAWRELPAQVREQYCQLAEPIVDAVVSKMKADQPQTLDDMTSDLRKLVSRSIKILRRAMHKQSNDKQIEIVTKSLDKLLRGHKDLVASESRIRRESLSSWSSMTNIEKADQILLEMERWSADDRADFGQRLERLVRKPRGDLSAYHGGDA